MSLRSTMATEMERTNKSITVLKRNEYHSTCGLEKTQHVIPCGFWWTALPQTSAPAPLLVLSCPHLEHQESKQWLHATVTFGRFCSSLDCQRQVMAPPDLRQLERLPLARGCVERSDRGSSKLWAVQTNTHTHIIGFRRALPRQELIRLLVPKAPWNVSWLRAH